MEVIKKYSVYAFNPVMGSDIHLALEEVEFKGWVYNSFDTEEEAIQALVKDEKQYTEYIILTKVYIR
jgi:hypothetical protein